MRKAWLLAAMFAVGCGGTVAEENTGDVSNDVAPTGRGALPLNAAKPTGSLVQAGIQYHGGPIMTGTKTAYVIWYGNWAGNTATTILPSLLSGVGGSAHFNINTTYTNNSGG